MREALRRRKRLLPALAVICLGCYGSAEVETSGQAPYFDLVGGLQNARSTSPTAAEKPLALAERQALFLPAGSSVEYLLFVEADSSLRVDSVVPRGRRARLSVTIVTDEQGETPIATIDDSTREASFSLSPDRRAAARLVLRAEAGGGEASEVSSAGVLLEKPAVWARATPPPPPASDAPAERRGTNVIFYVIDTLRRDRLGCYGYDRPISPNLDDFAARATLYLHAFGQSSWTKASMASVFTSTWPGTHGATGWKHKLAAEYETLPEVLRDADYQTVAFMTNPNMVQAYGFDQGFEDFYPKLKISSEGVNRRAFEWLDARDTTRPFFLYLHTMDPHAPYRPPKEYVARFAPRTAEMPSWSPRWKWPLEAKPFLSDLYDGDIAHNDANFGTLIAGLKNRGVYENTLIAVFSDHGEEFKEHGRYRHGNNLYAETLNIPLILKFPGQLEGRRVKALAQHVDLMPTVLDVLGLDSPALAQGRSLAGLNGVPEGRVFSHVRLSKNPLSLAVIDGEWKLVRIHRPEGTVLKLFNWKDDPGETRDRSSELPILTAVLDGLLEEKLAGPSEGATAEEGAPSPEVLEALKALGYLE